MHQWDNPTNSSTQWIISPVPTAKFDAGRLYLIENKHARGKFLNVAGGSNDNGANIHVRGACPELVIDTLTHSIRT